MTERSTRDITRRRFLGTAASAGAVAGTFAAVATPAIAQAKPTVVKWAHVYETSEPYHTEALWAAEEIKKRTNGKYEIQVFPASQLGNEPQINEGLGLGTVDIIYTGAAFVGGVHKPLSISNAPYIFRDFDHWKAYRASPAVPRSRRRLRKEDRPPDRGDDLLRRAAHDVEQGAQGPRRHEGHEAARAAGPALCHVRQDRTAPTPRRSPSPRSISRCSRARSTARRTRCRPSSPRSSTRCRSTST